jgi:hypothetical protein
MRLCSARYPKMSLIVKPVKIALLLALSAQSIFPQSQALSPNPRRATQAKQGDEHPGQTRTNPNDLPTGVDKGATSVANTDQQRSSNLAQYSAPVDWWSRVNSVLISIFTGGLTLLAWLQWRAMGRQAEYMREALTSTEITAKAAIKSAEVAELALKLTQRADVHLEGASIVDNAGRPSAILHGTHVALRFKNFGTTRAEDVIFDMRLEIDGVSAGDRPLGPLMLGPGESKTLAFETFGMNLTEGTANKIASGVIRFGFAGSVSYKDVFGTQHTMAFIAQFDALSLKFRIEPHHAT